VWGSHVDVLVARGGSYDEAEDRASPKSFKSNGGGTPVKGRTMARSKGIKWPHTLFTRGSENVKTSDTM